MWFYFVLSLFLFNPSLTEQLRSLESTVDLNDVFSSWPSYQHVAKMLMKRQAEVTATSPGQSGTSLLSAKNNTDTNILKVNDTQVVKQASEGNVVSNVLPDSNAKNTTKLPDISSLNSTTNHKNESNIVSGTATENANNTATNSTRLPVPPRAVDYQPDLSNPGVMMRGLIVFGAFALMAVAYFVFYRRKSKNSDSNNAHGTNDTNQFRYGVLQSDDRRDNLELSRIPLTMESDEDEDEDLEIFDLEQKKKSLSYVNLQTNDEYLVHEPRESITDRDNLLLDIEDTSSDQLINWSNNSNKSIL